MVNNVVTCRVAEPGAIICVLENKGDL
jgi:hypothetical protein